MSTTGSQRSCSRRISRLVMMRTLTIALTVASGTIACCGPQRFVAPRPGTRTCLPPMEAPTPVGTREAERMSEGFVLRVHDVRDILDLMPVVQLVGPGTIETVPPEDALIEGLLRDLTPAERVGTQLEATDSGAVLVRGTESVQAQVGESLHRFREELVRREITGAATPFDPGAPPDAPR